MKSLSNLDNQNVSLDKDGYATEYCSILEAIAIVANANLTASAKTNITELMSSTCINLSKLMPLQALAITIYDVESLDLNLAKETMVQLSQQGVFSPIYVKLTHGLTAV